MIINLNKKRRLCFWGACMARTTCLESWFFQIRWHFWLMFGDSGAHLTILNWYKWYLYISRSFWGPKIQRKARLSAKCDTYVKASVRTNIWILNTIKMIGTKKNHRRTNETTKIQKIFVSKVALERTIIWNCII